MLQVGMLLQVGGRDSNGQPRFASKRGAYDLNGAGFKGDVTGSEKDVAFRLPCNPALNWVAVFEEWLLFGIFSRAYMPPFFG